MPRPTTAHIAYGSLTVVLSTFALLLLSGARSGVGVVVSAAAGLLIGLLAASAMALRGVRRAAGAAASPVAAVHLPGPRTAGSPAETRLSEHSLRR
jgi:hypothetical protein